MADERFDAREGANRPLGNWTLLFRGFQVALDWKKLLLAAGGIVTMAFAWWLLAVVAVVIGGGEKPSWPGDYENRYSARDDLTKEQKRTMAWKEFKTDRNQWNLRHEAAGNPDSVHYRDAADIAATPEEYAQINERVLAAIKRIEETGQAQVLSLDGRTERIDRKPAGRMRLWPWFEDRGPNPYLMMTGQAGRPDTDGTPRFAPWDRGQFFEWFTTKQLPVLLEPLAKFARPVIYLIRPNPGVVNTLYFSLVILATLATWAFFGGAITRMAAVQLARKEKISLGEAVRFSMGQWKSYLFASLVPLVILAFLILCTILFGIPTFLIPVVGDIVGGLLWPLIFIAGGVMAAVLVGYLVGWPMIHATLSTEGSDSFDALSRTYSYVFQSPWNYLGYSTVALIYGALVVFFIGFMGSLMVYLGKWGVSQTPGSAYVNREPSYMFVHAPTSFGWRELLLQGASYEGAAVVQHGEVQPEIYKRYLESFKWYNHVGAFFVSIWVYLVFLMIIGFGYSYFWSAATIIYLLMRQAVDDTDLDEVYLEEEEAEDVYTPPPPLDATPTKTSAAPLTMVEPPSLRTPQPAPPPAPPPAATGTPDGNLPGANP